MRAGNISAIDAVYIFAKSMIIIDCENNEEHYEFRDNDEFVEKGAKNLNINLSKSVENERTKYIYWMLLYTQCLFCCISLVFFIKI